MSDYQRKSSKSRSRSPKPRPSIDQSGDNPTIIITLLARSLAPPIMSLGFVPRGFFRLAPVRCRFCLLQFAYFNLLSTHSALHFDHLLHKIYFTSVRYTIHHLMSRCRPLTSPAIFQCLLFSPTTAALLDSTLPTDHPHPSTPYHVIV